MDGEHKFLELGFPLPYSMVFLGYAFILLIDKVMFDSHSLVHEHEPIRESFRKSIIDSRRRANSHVDLNGIEGSNKAYEDQKNYSEFKDEDEPYDDQSEAEEINEGIRQYLSKADRFSARMSYALSQKRFKKGGKRNRDNNRMRSNTGEPSSTGGMRPDLRSSMEESDSFDDSSQGTKCDITPYILMIALSTHSVFEGIAVGLQDDIADVWSFFVAIGLHKWAAAMSLGISLSTNMPNNSSTVTILIIIFA